MALLEDEQRAWDQFFASAVIAVASQPAKNTGSPLDDLHNAPLSIAFRAAGLADAMLAERRKR